MTTDPETTFLLPDRATLDRILDDKALEVRYATALALIDDILCDYSDSHPRRMFQDRAELHRQIKELLGIDPPIAVDSANRGALRNLRINRRRAMALRKRARAAARTAERDGVRSEVNDFLDAMTSTFGQIRLESAARRLSSRAKGA